MHVARAAVVALLTLCGCQHVYPGDGTLVLVEADPLLYQRAIDGVTLATLLGEGVRYWDQVGTRLRMREQLGPEDRPDVAPVVHVRLSDLAETGEVSVAGQYDGMSTITFYYRLAIAQGADNFRTIAAHEAGHALGCVHIDPPDALMHAIVHTRNDLTDADIAEFHRAQGR